MRRRPAEYPSPHAGAARQVRPSRQAVTRTPNLRADAPCYALAVKLTIELEREVDGRWIAEVPELNVLLYGDSKQDAIGRAQSAAREIVLDRIAHGELPPDSADAVFDIAA